MSLHWNDCLTISGEYNLAAIVKIAHMHARADFSHDEDRGTYTYARCFASHLRTAWQVARTYKAALTWQVAA